MRRFNLEVQVYKTYKAIQNTHTHTQDFKKSCTSLMHKHTCNDQGFQSVLKVVSHRSQQNEMPKTLTKIHLIPDDSLSRGNGIPPLDPVGHAVHSENHERL